jgi:hypothetical protein
MQMTLPSPEPADWQTVLRQHRVVLRVSSNGSPVVDAVAPKAAAAAPRGDRGSGSSCSIQGERSLNLAPGHRRAEIDRTSGTDQAW